MLYDDCRYHVTLCIEVWIGSGSGILARGESRGRGQGEVNAKRPSSVRAAKIILLVSRSRA